MKKKFLLLALAAGLLFACKHDVISPGNNNTGSGDTAEDSDCDTTMFTYSDVVAEIMQNNCVVCHSTSFTSGGVDLSVYSGVKTVADNGKLIGAITHAAGFPAMPQGGAKLDDCEIRQIEKWIETGASKN
jgi:uncharacterized membrane protein